MKSGSLTTKLLTSSKVQTKQEAMKKAFDQKASPRYFEKKERIGKGTLFKCLIF